MTTASTDEPNWAMVVALLPELESPDFKPGTWHSRPGEIPYFQASASTQRLVQALDESGVVYSFDWGEWQHHAERLVQDERALARADLSTLRKLLVVHVRKDRFLEGHFAEMLASGHLVAILRRVVALRSELVKGEDNTAG